MATILADILLLERRTFPSLIQFFDGVLIKRQIFGLRQVAPANARRLLESLQRSLANDVQPQSIDDLVEAVGLGVEPVGSER